ncbi:CHAT domain-containing protein [Aliinostoc sp. HNIBRCY26]|uniref:CHAT domain-containing protein n=1 Tax=Aliinostoc sp. HNIBRCY26 TaxID=3418997 RepID=UPI003CFD1EDE
MMTRRHHLLTWLFIISLILCSVTNHIFITLPSWSLTEKISIAQGKSILFEIKSNHDDYIKSQLLLNSHQSNCLPTKYPPLETQGNTSQAYRAVIARNLNLIEETAPDIDHKLNFIINDLSELQMMEIKSYHNQDCQLTLVNNQVKDLNVSRVNTAIFNSIILNEKTAIIARFPRANQKLKLHWINIDSQTFREKVNQFRRGLENYGDIIYNPQLAQQLYDWMIRPFADDLETLEINTLVFIQDGILRSIPMAALHDGEKFLVEKYAIATTPSLSLTNLQTSKQNKVRALAVGLTQAAIVDGRRYEALKNVATEIREVKRQIPNSKQLLDQNFTRDRLKSELRETFYPIIHIATHGEFGQHPDETFLVTGDNQKLTITELDNIFRNISYIHESVDLLLLTACESAIGSERAALGLAGVAVQAGVKTALASLWSINDDATVKLVTRFYEAWCHSGVTKAEALRIAQRSLIANGGQSSHPAYWAAFVLVGNWL